MASHTTPATTKNGNKPVSATAATNGTKPVPTATAQTATTAPQTAHTAATKRKRGGRHANVSFKVAKTAQLTRAVKLLGAFAKRTMKQGGREGAPSELKDAAVFASSATATINEAIAAIGKVPDAWAPTKSAGARGRGDGESLTIGSSVWIVPAKRAKYEFALADSGICGPMTIAKADKGQVAVKMSDGIVRVFPKVHVTAVDPSVTKVELIK